jgi:2,3-bisphosphoglycerate-independent phosphoglycerate mutase
MKYVILIGDGMADYKIAELGEKTPLQYAKTPRMDLLAAQGEIGMVRTIPEGFPPGSDVANLSVMGYDPRKFYTGRSPLEAASMGIDLEGDDVAFRCNLVTLSEKDIYEETSMVDYSADEITTPEATELIAEANNRLGSKEMRFYAGFGFRHLLVWKGGPTKMELTPPHDLAGKVIAQYLPRGEGSKILRGLMRESNSFLPGHPVNRKRLEAGLRPANSIWFWGHGKKLAIPKFYDKYRLTGTVISAVDLIKGIGTCAGLDVVKVEGATGTIHTNSRGKVQAGLDELRKGKDFIYLHVEAPDAAGHRGELKTKIKAIEMVDQMLGWLLEGLDQFARYKVMLLPDHPTPLRIMTHTSDPVPFAIYTKGQENKNKNKVFDEEAAEKSGFQIFAGHELMDYFIQGKGCVYF